MDYKSWYNFVGIGGTNFHVQNPRNLNSRMVSTLEGVTSWKLKKFFPLHDIQYSFPLQMCFSWSWAFIFNLRITATIAMNNQCEYLNTTIVYHPKSYRYDQKGRLQSLSYFLSTYRVVWNVFNRGYPAVGFWMKFHRALKCVWILWLQIFWEQPNKSPYA